MQIGQGASQYGQGAAPSEIGLAGTLLIVLMFLCSYVPLSYVDILCLILEFV